MKKSIILIPSLLLISLCVYLLIKPLPISAKKVQSITIGNSTTYTPDKNIDEIKKIVSIYNDSRMFYKDVGTTPIHEVLIKFNNGKTIEIAVTDQGFHIVAKNGRAFKITNDELLSYFRKNPY